MSEHQSEGAADAAGAATSKHHATRSVDGAPATGHRPVRGGEARMA